MPNNNSAGEAAPFMKASLFFGASTGRTATMHLANCLNAESACVCVHEGKIRHRETPGEEILPFLTLENRLAYEWPDRAQDIINTKRAVIDELDLTGVNHFGDISYNYSPYLKPLSVRFPGAKLLVIVRDGRSFVRSATVLEGEDDAPVGWPPDDKVTSKMERYISLGRLQPRRGSSLEAVWPSWSAYQKNVWLWAETNALLLDSLETIDTKRYLLVRFEDFVSDALRVYSRIREFLGFEGAVPEAVEAVLLSPVVNARKSFGLPAYNDWTGEQKAHFHQFAGSVMDRLGYSYE
jgi:hypothetical protein